MLRIIRPTGDGCFVGTPDTGSEEILADGTYLGHHFGFLMTFHPSIDWIFPIDGKITTTPSDAREGENDCFHLGIDGVITPKGQLTFPYSAPQSVDTMVVPYHGYWPNMMKRWKVETPSRGTKWYTHQVLYGEDFNFHDEFKATTYLYDRYSRVDWPQNLNGFSRWCKTYQLIAASYTDRNGYTWIYVIGVDFDPRRGVRWALPSLTHVQDMVKGKVTSPDTLYQRIQELFPPSNYTPGGAYSWNGFGKVVGNTVDLGPSLDDVHLSQLLHDNVDQYLPLRIPDMGELSYKCVKQLKTWDGNGIALAKDLATLKEQVSAIRSTLSRPESPKSWASLFLSAKYGIPLTISDLKSLSKGLEQYLKFSSDRKVSSSTSWLEGKCTYECHYGIYYNPYDVHMSKLHEKLLLFDAAPSYKNVWDLVPFSFVVDWFVDVGNYLDHLDKSADFTLYNVIADVTSLKICRSCYPSDLGFPMFEGAINIKKYYRTFGNKPVVPTYDKNDLSPQSFDHWIESGALMVQKIVN